jgi:lantibiotic biosynthesis protein
MQATNFFVLRRPIYPLNRLDAFYTQVSTHSLPDALRAFYKQPLAQEAIFAASPALYDRCQQWLAGEPIAEERKLLSALHKYLIRMCSRSTPYGLFAGCAVGTFGPHSQLPAGAAQFRTAIDIEALQAITDWLTRQPAIRQALLLRPNSSVYAAGTSLRYVEQQREGPKRAYFISGIDSSPDLSQVLEAAHRGATIGQLTDLLAHGAADLVRTQAQEYIEQLIDSQLLVFEPAPTLTGPSYLPLLAARIAALPAATGATEAVQALLTLLNQPHELPAHRQLRQWFAEQRIEPPTADVVLVNTFFADPAPVLGEGVLRHLQTDLQALRVLNQPPRHPDLDTFRQRFVNRYEEEEIALPLALDSDFGIGYGDVSTQGIGYAPLIDDLSLSSTTTTTTSAGWDWWQQLVMHKYAEVLRTNADELVLTDGDLRQIEQQTKAALPPLPFSAYAIGSLLAASEKALDTGDFRFTLLACAGPSALNLLSRFGKADDALATYLQTCVAAEEAHYADVVLAEIVHLPENRVGNVLMRPRLYQYEIPYLGQSSVDPAFQIPINDLMVSVRRGQVVLRSKRLNRRVIPRLSTAHNFRNGLPLYRFLCDLQSQDMSLKLAWNWGVLAEQTYLPRVRYRHIILSRATWQLSTDTLTPDNPLKLVAQLTALGLPDQFLLAHADNELLIQLHLPASLDLLIAEIKKSRHIRLVEALQQPSQCPVGKGRDRYTQEVILPFLNPQAPALPGLFHLAPQGVERRFSVGSEWFYLKIYTGEKTADRLLVEVVQPVVQQLLDTQIISAFFFIRYHDTDPHLRLRFRGNPHVGFYQYVIRAIEQASQEAVASGVIYRIQVDTYQRELERYGFGQIDRCEQLFYYDSLSTLTLLTQTDGIFNEEWRFSVAVSKIEQLLAGLALTTEDRWRLLEDLKGVFFDEFGGEPALRHQLNEKYRLYRPLIEELLITPANPVSNLHPWTTLQAGTLAQLTTDIPDTKQRATLARSLIHMIVNRLFPSKQRLYELVLYHCLAKYYGSLKARQ